MDILVIWEKNIRNIVLWLYINYNKLKDFIL